VMEDSLIPCSQPLTGFLRRTVYPPPGRRQSFHLFQKRERIKLNAVILDQLAC